jgi:hypothetical protein
LSACAYEAPIDPDAADVLNGITGSVVFSGRGAPSTTFVTLYRADDPGPPAGTGSPITFTTVPAGAFTGRDQGMEAAPFAFTQVPDGTYYINALMDHDGDFNPFGAGVAGATCDDAVGSHLGDLVAFEPTPVEVKGGELLENVPVLLGSPLPTERPAFTTPEGFTISRAKLAASLDAKGNPVVENLQLLPLQAVGVAAAYSEDLLLDLVGPCEPAVDCTDLPSCPCVAETECETALPVWLVDRDADGEVDPYPAELQASLGLLDVWPRVYLEYLGDPATDPVSGAPTFANDLGTFRHQGEELPERWVTEAFPLAADLQGAALYGLPLDGVAGGPIGVPFGANALRVTLSPVFRHYHGDGVVGVDANGPYDLVDLLDPSVPAEAVPAGTWSVTVIGPSGQTWTVPNELGLLGLPATAAGYDPATQARGVVVE